MEKEGFTVTVSQQTLKQCDKILESKGCENVLGQNQVTEGSLDCVTNNSEFNSIPFSVSQSHLESDGKNEVSVENVVSADVANKSDDMSLESNPPSNMEASESDGKNKVCLENVVSADMANKRDDVSLESNPLSNMEASVNKGINLFVQLFCSQDGSNKSSVDNVNKSPSQVDRDVVKYGNDESTLSKSGNRGQSAGKTVVNGKSASTGKCHELRERKKSKYLSYPYVDVNKGIKTAAENGTEGKETHKISKSDNINASSVKLLGQLHSMALHGFYGKKGKKVKTLDSLKRFYSSFRVFTFLDHEKLQNCPEAHVFPRRSKKKKEGVKNSSEIGGQETGSDVPIKGKKTSTKTKKTKVNPELPQVNSIANNPEHPQVNSIANSSSAMGCHETGPVALETGPIAQETGLVAQETGSVVPSAEQTSKKRMNAEETPQLPQVHMMNGLQLDLNGNNNTSFSLEKFPFYGTSTPKGKLIPKRKNLGLFGSPDKNNVNFEANMISFSTTPGLNDVQISSPRPNDGTGLKDDAKIRNTESTPLVAVLQPEFKKREREMNTDGNALSADGKPEQKRRRRRYKSDPSDPSANANKILKKEEDLGAVLFLTFAPGSPPPTKEALIPIFSRFGLLKESETRVIDESTAQIAYERKSDGGFAYRSLEKSSPFGASLASFKISFPGSPQTADGKNSVGPTSSVPARRPSVTATRPKALAKPPEAPSLIAMRKNVEMMKDFLEKQGDTLSPEMRMKLENEIKGFLEKISATVGPSSSS